MSTATWGGDYVWNQADWTGVNGNISEDPLFCQVAGVDRLGRLRAAEQVALTLADAKCLEHGKFACGLDSFCKNGRAGFVTEKDQRGRQCPAGGIAVDIARQTHVELDDVRRQLDDMLQAGIACARIVDGEPKAGLAQGIQCLAQGAIIVDRCVFGHLQHEPFKRQTIQMLSEAIIEHGGRRRIE